MRFVKRKGNSTVTLPLVGVAGFLLDVVEKVDEGRIGNYRFVAFEITPDEIEKRMPKAREKAASVLNIDLPKGLSEEEVERLRRLVREGKLDYYTAVMETWLKATGSEPDFSWIPGTEEFAAEILLNEILARDPSLPALEAQVRPEEGYGMPEYSLYLGPDVRGFNGRWFYPTYQTGEGFTCFATTLEPEECDRLIKKIDDLLERARERGRELIVAYWEEEEEE